MPDQSIHIAETQEAISIRVRLAAYVRKEEPGIYLSYCPALDLYSQGDTVKEAREAIAEAIHLLISGCLEDGTLHEVLRECGFFLESQKRPARKRSSQKAVKDFGGKPVKIPAVEIPLLAA